MNFQNNSHGKALLLLGFSEVPDLQLSLFVVFLLIYIVTVLGNLIIILIICLSQELHNPMYFLISNLSFLDISYSSVTQPQLLSILAAGPSKISFAACITQLYVFMSLACTEFVSLTAMSYDRYVAICKPLHYPILMNKKVCLLLATASWVVGFLDPLAHTVVISQLPLCRPRVINHFFCDLSELLNLSCVDKLFIEIMSYVFGSVVGLPAFLLTLISYIFIISNILKITSSAGRHKAFSTCASHLTVVILYYGSVLIMHMRPSSQHLLAQDKPLSVLYTAIIPMLNPLIYSLRNKDVKKALFKLTTVNLYKS
ncbi:olfactory receptor 6F1-like [Anomaloglossus baeobatrachus]|uniref:olfactory receptor 6F1-like n=1 Tax=Anomaloglossus baeobatrachus TaxID=238106 RepID=UPI003F502491